MLEAILKKRGHEVVAVENGRKAWEAFKKDYFHVLIADWLMPEMDGLALCREIRKWPQENYTYLVMLTSLEGKTNYIEAMDAGADDFLTKPFDADQLLARIQVAGRILGLRKHVAKLEGLLAICASCKKIRDIEGNWQRLENYIQLHSEARFTHGICPGCYEKSLRDDFIAEKLAK